MKKIIVAFLLFVHGSLLAQEASPVRACYDCQKEELLTQLSKAKTNSERIGILHNLSLNGIENDSVYDTIYLHQLIKLNQSAKLVKDDGYKTLLAASTAVYKNDYNGALALMKKATDQFDEANIEAVNLLTFTRVLYNKLNDQEGKYAYYSGKLNQYLKRKQYANTAAVYHCLGGYYGFKGDFNSSINNYLKSAELFKPISTYWYINEIMVVGAIYNDWGNTEKAKFYLEQGLTQELNSKFDYNREFALHALAGVAYSQKRYKESLSYLDGTGKVKYTPDSLHQPIGALIMALNYIELRQTAKAYELLMEAGRRGKEVGLGLTNVNGQFEIDYGFYKYYAATGRPKEAEPYLLAAFEKAKQNKDVKLTGKYQRELVNFFLKNGNLGEALKHSTQYINQMDSLNTRLSLFHIASYESEMKENEQNKKLTSLQQEYAVQQATIKQRNLILWISLAAFLVVCGSLILIYRQLRINKRVLKKLQETQKQLVQAEKMASLGELTAGIAHEIQNPLNFINNFSEVSSELVGELREELQAGRTGDALALAGDLDRNLEKIVHHGRRADSIVKNMLQHSRKSSGQKEPTDINALVDEYLRLSYHGLRAKDKSFNALMETHFDPAVGKVQALPQDMGRVLLNLFNNAFYSVHQKKKSLANGFEPTVYVTTQKTPGGIVIKVRDNGLGIPQSVVDKIYQPFFTTKPTGEGTGLGLSMSYDIITKGHGGKLEAQTQEGEYAQFEILLPA
jgi:two-component system, NtrC family, sensor kinase